MPNSEEKSTNWSQILTWILVIALGLALVLWWLLWSKYNQMQQDISGLKGRQPSVSGSGKLSLNGTVISLGKDNSVDIGVLVAGGQGPAGANGIAGAKGSTGAAGVNGTNGSVGVATAQNGTTLSGTT